MALKQFSECVRIAVDVTAQQFLVRQAAFAGLVGLSSRRRPLIDRLARFGQRVALWRLVVRFRRFLPPPW
jgi:hypothetical protein